jgi:pimeloyl-ACP methyl ester carboxylesterase
MKLMKGLLLMVGLLVAIAAIGFWMRPLNYFDEFTYLEEAFTGVQNHETTVGGYRMHYETAGPATGQPVVLIHGLGGRAEDWRALAPSLVSAGYRVYMPDLIGYGRSAQPRNFSYSVRDEAALVVDFLNNMRLARVDLGGWSMGGWVVQLIAAAHPERVKRLILFDSAGLFVHPTWSLSLFTPTTPAQLDRLNALLMPDPPRIPGFVTTDILRVSKESGWVVERAMAQMLTGRDVTNNLLPQLKMPVLLVWGSDDHIIPLAQGEAMHRLVPQSQLDVVPGCGHLAPLQCTRSVGPAVIKFIQDTPAYHGAAPAKALPETAIVSASGVSGPASDTSQKTPGRHSLFAGVLRKPTSMAK